MTPEKMRALQVQVDELKKQNKLLTESMLIKIDRIKACDKVQSELAEHIEAGMKSKVTLGNNIRRLTGDLKKAKAKIKCLEG